MKGLIIKRGNEVCKAGIPDNGVSLMVNITRTIALTHVDDSPDMWNRKLDTYNRLKKMLKEENDNIILKME